MTGVLLGAVPSARAAPTDTPSAEDTAPGEAATPSPLGEPGSIPEPPEPEPLPEPGPAPLPELGPAPLPEPSPSISAGPPSPETPQRPRTDATPEDEAPSVSLSLGVQFIEIVQVSPNPQHVTALVVPGLTIAGLVSPRWALYGVLGLSTGIDTVSVGGSAVLGADAAVVQRGGWRFGLGPEFAFIQSATRAESAWSWASIFTGGFAMSLGRGRTVFSTGLAASVSPQFAGAVSLVPRLGVSVAF